MLKPQHTLDCLSYIVIDGNNQCRSCQNVVTNILKNHMSTFLDKTDNILDFRWPSVPGFPSRWLWLRISLLVFEWSPRSAAPRKLSRQFLVWGSTGRVDESGRKPGLPKHNRLLDDGFLGKNVSAPISFFQGWPSCYLRFILDDFNIPMLNILSIK